MSATIKKILGVITILIVITSLSILASGQGCSQTAPPRTPTPSSTLTESGSLEQEGRPDNAIPKTQTPGGEKKAAAKINPQQNNSPQTPVPPKKGTSTVQYEPSNNSSAPVVLTNRETPPPPASPEVGEKKVPTDVGATPETKTPPTPVVGDEQKKSTEVTPVTRVVSQYDKYWEVNPGSPGSGNQVVRVNNPDGSHETFVAPNETLSPVAPATVSPSPPAQPAGEKEDWFWPILAAVAAVVIGASCLVAATTRQP